MDIECLELNSDSISLQKFDDDFSDPDRRALVKELNFTILLPPITNKRIKKFQSKKEAAANSAAITNALLALFSRLSTWELEDSDSIKLLLYFKPVSEPHIKNPSRIWKHDGPPISTIRNSLKYLGLVESLLPSSGKLPEVRCVSEIELYVAEPQLHPSVFATLFAALPVLRKAIITLSMPPRRYTSQRREIRSTLASALQEAALDNLEELTIFLDDPAPEDQRFQPDVFTGPDGRDDLSLAVQRLLHLPKLRKAQFATEWSLSPVVFRTDTSFGPCLERLTFSIIPVTPEGKWLLTGDEEDAEMDRDSPSADEAPAELDSEDSDATDYVTNSWVRENGDKPRCFFRRTLDSTTFDPLLESLAQGVRKMPALRLLDLSMANRDGEFRLDYFAAGVKDESTRKRGLLMPKKFALDRDFDVVNERRPRWVMRTDDEESFDGSWTPGPGVIGAMETGGGRVMFTEGDQRRYSIGDGQKMVKTPQR